MPVLTIDGEEIEVPAGMTVLQACEAAGKEIPVFCFHPRLNIAGNCRMCLVEMERSPKPVASCAMPAGDGMVIKTNTDLVHKARRGVLEMLLINHPLDCPICDQGGECDLQDITLFYGPDKSRFEENKRPVEDKYLGPLISTHMTRCIHCTRCVRFINEVAGIEELGACHRGEHMEITTWVDAALSSELSGNIIDLCPVGALNSKPYEYKARIWELRKTESVDIHDALGSNIRIDTRGNEVMRIVPRLNEEINEEWISDKARFAYDGLKNRRLDRPFVRKDGKLKEADWGEALSHAAELVNNIDGRKAGFLIGDQVDCETMVLIKEFAARLECPNIDCRQDGAKLNPSNRASYLFNTTIAGIEEADCLLIIGANTRLEAPVLNARIRKRYLRGGFKAGRIGEPFDLTFPVKELGAGSQTLFEIANGAHEFCDVLKNASKPMLIIGTEALLGDDGGSVLDMTMNIAQQYGMIQDEWNGFNFLHHAAARAGAMELSMVPGEGGLDQAGMIQAARNGELDVLFAIGVDELDLKGLASTKIIYLGTHGDQTAHHAEVIWPGAAYTEKSAIYVNTEGRPQATSLAAFPPGDAKEDWKIIRAFSQAAGHKIELNTIDQVRHRLAELAPQIAKLDEIQCAEWEPVQSTGEVSNHLFSGFNVDYYKTNPIARASAVMDECSGVKASKVDLGATGTDG